MPSPAPATPRRAPPGSALDLTGPETVLRRTGGAPNPLRPLEERDEGKAERVRSLAANAAYRPIVSNAVVRSGTSLCLSPAGTGGGTLSVIVRGFLAKDR